MSDNTDRPTSKVWFITGAGRGIGVSLAREALAAGHSVIATGRQPSAVSEAIGEHENLLCARLDVTQPGEATAAADEAVGRFGRIDVLVNNAGSSYKGFFEEMSLSQVDEQLATNLLGPMNVTRAVLPIMRRQRHGHVISVSSGAGLMGFPYSSVYAASKFGLEGWMGALAAEIQPFGISTTIVNPGWFRTGLTSPESMVWPDVAVADYAERSAEQRQWWESQDGQQAGDPTKLARALLLITHEHPIPARFIAGADVLQLADRKIAELREQMESHRELSGSLSFD